DLVAWGAAHPLVRAMLLTSTRAIDTAPRDLLSDYDVILVVAELDPFVQDRGWLNDFGEVLVVFWDAVLPDPDFGIDQCGNVTQYADGLKIDWTLWPQVLFEQIVALPDLPAELDAGYRVLLDKDGLTGALRPPTGRAYLPQLPSHEAYQIHINDFLTDAPYVAKCLWRGDLLPARWCLDCDMKHTYLRPMLDWRMAIETGWSVPVGYLGKGLQRYLPAELWAEVEHCFNEHNQADTWAALLATMELFRRVGREVGVALGYAYPDELHERVVAYVAQIRQLERPAT
ncbi:MAG TPA: aminoglycoside 6-adenylyltransferase, partial [Roseiflexaceae bacterium]|nr:aminoglycoside 6-adenylyltransferase [Roseiflexaceae bacterium]